MFLQHDEVLLVAISIISCSGLKLKVIRTGLTFRMKMTAFWNKVPCSLVEADRPFRGAYCLHHQGSLQAYFAVMLELRQMAVP
jgi:hypothetical protein